MNCLLQQPSSFAYLYIVLQLMFVYALSFQDKIYESLSPYLHLHPYRLAPEEVRVLW